jgi:hypothetical protein
MPADPHSTYAFPLFSDLVRRIEALGFTPGGERPLGWVVAEAERLRADYVTVQARYTARRVGPA